MGFEKILQVINKFELVELRLDLLDLSNEEYDILLQYAHKLIVTFRSPDKKNEKAIGQISQAINKKVRYIDIDLNETENYLELLSELSAHNTQLILSVHNLSETPSDTEIDNLIFKMSVYKPDILKLCFKAAGVDEIIRTMKIYQNYPKKSIVAFNLGQNATLSRILAYKAGSTLIYVSIDSESKTEESQLTYNQAVTLLDIL